MHLLNVEKIAPLPHPPLAWILRRAPRLVGKITFTAAILQEGDVARCVRLGHHTPGFISCAQKSFEKDLLGLRIGRWFSSCTYSLVPEGEGDECLWL